jgi:hypothetical protein
LRRDGQGCVLVFVSAGAIRSATAALEAEGTPLPEGCGIPALGGSGVGAELVLRWHVGAIVADSSQDSATQRGNNTSRSSRSGSRHRRSSAGGASESKTGAGDDSDADGIDTSPVRGPKQPPYVVTLETCGILGGPAQRAGKWSRVVLDPAQRADAVAVLTSIPATSYIPLNIDDQVSS